MDQPEKNYCLLLLLLISVIKKQQFCLHKIKFKKNQFDLKTIAFTQQLKQYQNRVFFTKKRLTLNFFELNNPDLTSFVFLG